MLCPCVTGLRREKHALSTSPGTTCALHASRAGAETGIQMGCAAPCWQRMSSQHCSTVMGAGDSRGTKRKNLDLERLQATWKRSH